MKCRHFNQNNFISSIQKYAFAYNPGPSYSVICEEGMTKGREKRESCIKLNKNGPLFFNFLIFYYRF